MTKDHWFDEESNQEIRSFICQDFVFEDPVWQNNPQNAIQLNFTSIPKRKRSSFVVGFLHELLYGKDFFLCEYGSIGISDKKKLVKGHPSKENCFEFQGFNEDIDYLYHNVTYIKVRAGQLNIRHFVRSVFKRVCPACNYYLILFSPVHNSLREKPSLKTSVFREGFCPEKGEEGAPGMTSRGTSKVLQNSLS